jgi:hypothetical protein
MATGSMLPVSLLRRPRAPLHPDHFDHAAAAPPAADGAVIDHPGPQDAAGVAACFRAVYGGGYLHPDVYDAQRYLADIARGDLIAVVARDRSGTVVGHLALEMGPGSAVAERGEAVVLPAWRGRGLLERMTERLFVDGRQKGLAGIYAVPLTVHLFSQKNDAHASMPTCAVLLGVEPEESHPAGLPFPTAGQRQSYLRAFRYLLPPAPRAVGPAGPYAAVVRHLFGLLGAASIPVVVPDPAAPTRLSAVANPRGCAHVMVESIGSDVGNAIVSAVATPAVREARTVRLALPLAGAGLDRAIEAARALGFFFSGLGPSFSGDADILELQRLAEPLDTGKLQILTDQTRELLAFVEADRRSVA